MDPAEDLARRSAVKRVDKQLRDRRENTALFDQLEQFGSVLVEEVIGRTSIIESKALSILGWSTALLGFLLFTKKPTELLALWLLRGATVASIVSIAAASAAAWVRDWHWPSANDWFCEDYLDNVPRLRIYHLLSWLETHQRHSGMNADKARALAVAQWALIAAAIAVGTAVLTGLV